MGRDRPLHANTESGIKHFNLNRAVNRTIVRYVWLQILRQMSHLKISPRSRKRCYMTQFSMRKEKKVKEILLRANFLLLFPFFTHYILSKRFSTLVWASQQRRSSKFSSFTTKFHKFEFEIIMKFNYVVEHISKNRHSFAQKVKMDFGNNITLH